MLLFGSYLFDKERIGDIDLALSFKSKVDDISERRRLEQQKVNLALRQGREFSNIVEQLSWPQTEVKHFLKNRSRAFSLHGIEEPVSIDAEYKEIYLDQE